MSTPCPPSNGDHASDCNAPATEVTGGNVVRFPVERCRRPRPAGDQWVAGQAAGLLSVMIATLLYELFDGLIVTRSGRVIAFNRAPTA